MTFFLQRAFGVLPGGSWSAGIISQGSISESAAQTAWHTGWGTLWGDITTLVGTDTTLTKTSTSTASPTFKQTTVTANTEALAGTSASVSLPGRLAVRATMVTAQATKAGTHSGFDLPAYAVNAVAAGGVLSATAITDTVNGVKALMDSLVLSGLTPVSVNKGTGVSIAVVSFKIRNTFVSRKNRISKQPIIYSPSGL